MLCSLISPSSVVAVLLASTSFTLCAAAPRRLKNSLQGRKKPSPSVQVLSPHDIQGSKFLSDYDGQTVQDLKGLVTAKS